MATNRPIVPARVRDYAYPILLAAAPLAVIYGLTTEAEAAAWVGLGGAVLGLGTATAYRPARTLPVDSDG